jgi:hypothetical protein
LQILRLGLRSGQRGMRGVEPTGLYSPLFHRRKRLVVGKKMKHFALPLSIRTAHGLKTSLVGLPPRGQRRSGRSLGIAIVCLAFFGCSAESVGAQQVRSAAKTHTRELFKLSAGTACPDRDYVGDEGPHPKFVSSVRLLLAPPELPSAALPWVSDSLEWADYIFTMFPPSIPEPPERRAALLRVDDVLHLPDAATIPAVETYYVGRIEGALDSIEHSQIAAGARIWKLYNHGFVVKTSGNAFAFDIVSGTQTPGISISDADIRRIVDSTDVLFISHWHPDHADKRVVRAYLKAGKPVIAPPQLWDDDPEFAGKLVTPNRQVEYQNVLKLPSGHDLRYIAYPGHQGTTVLNNVYLVSTDSGFSVVHTGDQYAPSPAFPDYQWLSQISCHHGVDVLLINGWTPGLNRIAAGIHPRLLITGHEDELAHEIPHRESYSQSYNRLFCTTYPYLVMTWGENFSYRASDF